MNFKSNLNKSFNTQTSMHKLVIIFVILLCSAFLLVGSAWYLARAKQVSPDLPVRHNTVLYPSLSLPELTASASIVVRAEVVRVGDTILKEIPVSLSEDMTTAGGSIGIPVTPVTLAVRFAIKGDTPGKKLTYYEDGGQTDTYIQLPNGYAMEKGMEVILFLNADGYGWGAQSIFPVDADQVILTNEAADYIGRDNVATLETQALDSCVKNQIKAKQVPVMPVDAFIHLIQSMETE